MADFFIPKKFHFTPLVFIIVKVFIVKTLIIYSNRYKNFKHKNFICSFCPLEDWIGGYFASGFLAHGVDSLSKFPRLLHFRNNILNY